MFARAAGRVARCSSGVSVLQGTCHPPLAASTPQRSPRLWKDSQDEDADSAGADGRGGAAGLPLFLFCHANGFCKEVWRPVVEELSKVARAPFRWIALDFSGHGDSAKAVPTSGRWGEFAIDDIVSVLKEFQGDSRYVVGIGHSLGGAGLLLTEMSHKGEFDRLALFEPVVLPHPDDLQRLTGLTEQQWVGHMQKNALKRRNDFADLGEIRKYMKSRKAFQGFDERAMEEYIHHGTRLNDNGVGHSLKCHPQAEASVYGGRPYQLWDTVGKVECEALIACGSKSVGMMNQKHFSRLVARMAKAKLAVAPNSGHFLVMENPVWCALQIEARAVGAGQACEEDLPMFFAGLSKSTGASAAASSKGSAGAPLREQQHDLASPRSKL